MRGPHAFLPIVALVALVACRSDARPLLVLATTTSVGNAGLLEKLLPAYEHDHRIRFGMHLAGVAVRFKCSVRVTLMS